MQQIVTMLDQYGYFDSVPVNDRPQIRDKCIKYSTLMIDETNRFVYCDPEHLAEQGISSIMPEVRRLMDLSGISLDFEERLHQGYSYSLVYKSKYIFNLWQYVDIAMHNFWSIVYIRFASIIRWVLINDYNSLYNIYINVSNNDGLMLLMPRICEPYVLAYGFRSLYGEELFLPPVAIPLSAL